VARDRQRKRQKKSLLERRRSLFFPLPKLCILIALLSLVFVVPMRFRTLGAGRPTWANSPFSSFSSSCESTCASSRWRLQVARDRQRNRETKGYSLEQIDEVFARGHPFKAWQVPQDMVPTSRNMNQTCVLRA
jgi:hypothetical protein